MKKFLFLLLAFFSFSTMSLAKEIKIGFDEDINPNQTIKFNKKDKLSVAIYYKSDDFDLLAILADLEYDKEKLELIDYQEANGFTVTNGEKLLADRYGDDYPDNGKVVTLNFKVKKYSDIEIKLKNIVVANLEEEINVSDVTVKLDANGSNMFYIVGSVIVLAGAIGSFIFFKNANGEADKNKKKKKEGKK
ncbi:MAG: hypothetical protein IJA94_04660 [Bacilli bacterium]|nr:hypothetical protein [Bacilli bacterium]